MTNLEWATRYWQVGWPVFPCRSKKPLVSWRVYSDTLPEPELLKTWWTAWPDAQIALATGHLSQITVVDIDSHGPERPVDVAGSLPLTVRSCTGGGGIHLFCRYAAVGNSVKSIHPQIDVKSDGGYIILPPSIHSSGRAYAWDPLFPFDEVNLPNLATLPTAVIERLKTAQTLRPDWERLVGGVPAGSRNMTAARVAGKVLYAFSNDRNWQAAWKLFRAWNNQNDPPLSEIELRSVFASILTRHISQMIDL